MDNVLNFIDTLKISKDEPIIVACSSGPDSMMLLYLLSKLGYKCVCAHVNHQVREESLEEYAFLEEYCKKNNIIFEGYTINKYKNNRFSEVEARHKRYDFFGELINKYQSNYLFTAHHGDDLIETVMMRLVRGSSIYGYMGFTKVTNYRDFKIVRPIMYLTKDAILKYNEDNNIPFYIDKTNELDDHTRNRIRHHVLPELKKEDSSVHEKFLKYNEKIDDLVHYVDRIIMKNYNSVFTNEYINIDLFKELDQYEQKLIVEKILDINYPDNLYLISDKHTNLIFDMINSDGNKVIDLPNNLKVYREYNYIKFSFDSDSSITYDYVLEDEVNTPLGTITKVRESNDTSNFTIYLNSHDLCLPLRVRTFLDGDKIRVKNLNGSKKINDIFIDLKIPKEKRNKWPIVVDANNQVVWLPGLKKSEFDSQNNNTYDIILRYQEEENK